MNRLKQLVYMLHLAWLWLILFGLHILVVEYFQWQNQAVLLFSKLVYFSCFLMFPIGEALEDTKIFWLFFVMQFSFWALVSLVNTFIYRKFNK